MGYFVLAPMGFGVRAVWGDVNVPACTKEVGVERGRGCWVAGALVWGHGGWFGDAIAQGKATFEGQADGRL